MSSTAAAPLGAGTDAFSRMDATAQAHLVRTGEVSPLDLVDAAINRIERLNPKINAVASMNFDEARSRARTRTDETPGPFAGVPTLIKDLLAYPGHQAGLGSRLFKGQPSPPASPYAEAIDESGLIVLGKSTTSEFGLLGTTETLAYGATRNPWDLSHSPGGSSGGAVAAVASGMVPIAHASDGGGSIRGPASFCGLFGFKPSRGRTIRADSPSGDSPLAGLMSDHCVSKSVRDSAAWLAATGHPDGTALPMAPTIDDIPAPLRIGVYRTDVFGRPADAEVDAALNETIGLCGDLGHQVVPIDPPVIDAAETSKAFFGLTGLALGGLFDQVRAMMANSFDETLIEPFTRTLVDRGSALDQAAIERMNAALAAGEKDANRIFEQCDVVLSPTVPFAAFPLGQFGPDRDPDDLMAFIERLAGYTIVASLAGAPAMSVPLHWTAGGLPIGSHFTASPGRDALLFSLAYQLEAALPWQDKLAAQAERFLCRSA